MYNYRKYLDLYNEMEKNGLDHAAMQGNFLIQDEKLIKKIRLYLKVYADLKDYIIKKTREETELDG